MIDFILMLGVLGLSVYLTYLLSYKRGMYDLNTHLVYTARFGNGMYVINGGGEFLVTYKVEFVKNLKEQKVV